MKSQKILFVLLLTIFWSLSTQLLAQTTTAPNNKPMDKKEKLHFLIQQRLVDSLNLTPDQSQKISEIMKKYHQKRRELREQMKKYHQQLETLATSSDNTQISQLINNIQKNREEARVLDDSRFKEIKNILNPQQQVQYFLMMEKIHHDMMQIKRGPNSEKPNF